MQRNSFTFPCLLLITLWFGGASAAFAQQDIQHKVRVREAERHLNAMQAVVAQFTQTAPDGEVSYGTFFYKKPGKLRWQYQPPVPLLIVSEGTKLAYQDFELDQVSYLSIDETLMGLFARPTLKLEGEFTIPVARLVEEDRVLEVRLQQKQPGNEDSLLLAIDRKTGHLLRMELTDASQRTTMVRFSDWKDGQTLENSLFRIDEVQRMLNRREKIR